MPKLSTPVGLCAIALASVLATSAAHAGLKPVSIVQLVERAEVITAGTVTSVFDGFDDQNIPYTQITLAVDQTIKGVANGTFTFRQFGLLKPRERANGSWDLNVTPQEWPRFGENESVMVFLYDEAIQTGFRAPIGLSQGALRVVEGEILNAFGNVGLFKNVYADPGLLSAEEEAMFTTNGALPADTFIEFVRRAVSEGWIDEGRLNHVEP